MNETSFNRGSWVVLILSTFLLAAILWLNIYRYNLPTDGWVIVEGAGLTENMLGLPSGIQPGDMPISLGGLPFDGLRGERPDTWRAGGMVQYVVQRDNQTLTLPVPIGHWTLESLGRGLVVNWQSYLIGLLYFVIGIFVFTHRPGNAAAQVLLLLGTIGLSMALVFIVPVSLADNLDLVALIGVIFLGYYIWGILLFPTLFLLSLVFPRMKRPFRTHPGLTVAILYSLELVLIILVGGPFAELGPVVGFGMVAVYSLLTVISVLHTVITERHDPVAQAQIRWVGFGVALVAGYQFLTNIIGFMWLNITFPGWWDVVHVLVYLALPIAIGIAVMRYRLWDIDLIIRKTLQYSILTSLLALIYFGSVVLLQGLTENIFGEQSPLVIVLSTLGIAALFSPLRTRVQEFIDRRFYRQKYDAEKALAEFAAAARSETDLAQLSERLKDTVDGTLQPEFSQLWIIRK